MLKFRRVVCTLLVCSLVAVAYSKAGRVKVLTAAGQGLTLNPDVEGGVVMNFHDSVDPKSEVQLRVKGLEPNTMYGVQVDPGVTDADAFTTNASGTGHWHGFAAIDVTSLNPVVRIFVYDGNFAEITHVSFDELRAIGCLTEECSVGDPCSVDRPCDDQMLCTVDTCDGGFCFHAPLDCDDGKDCVLASTNCDTGLFGLCFTEDETGELESGCCINSLSPCP